MKPIKCRAQTFKVPGGARPLDINIQGGPKQIKFIGKFSGWPWNGPVIRLYVLKDSGSYDVCVLMNKPWETLADTPQMVRFSFRMLGLMCRLHDNLATER